MALINKQVIKNWEGGIGLAIGSLRRWAKSNHQRISQWVIKKAGLRAAR